MHWVIFVEKEIRYIYLDLPKIKKIDYLNNNSFLIRFEIEKVKLDGIISNDKIPETDIKSLLRRYRLDKFYSQLNEMPLHMQNKIGNSRDNLNELYDTMQIIYDNFEDYSSIFTEKEIINSLNSLFDEAICIIIKKNLKIRISEDSNKYVISNFNEIIKGLLNEQGFKEKLNLILFKFGVPFLNSNCKNQVKINLDSFIILGVLINLVKLLLFEDYKKTEEIYNIFDNIIIKSSKLSSKLLAIILDCYIVNVINTFNSTMIEKFKLYNEIKNIRSFINLFDFYFQWFNYNYENYTKEFREILKTNECELIRKYYINKIESNNTKGKDKKLKSVREMNNTQLLRKFRKDKKSRN